MSFADALTRGGGDLAVRAVRAGLAPAELLFRALNRAYHGAYDRRYLPVYRVAVPVISVGNLTIGGSGKTPVVRWLAAELHARGARPAVLHGGYGLDEPALHRVWNPDVPVYVGKDRVRSAGEAIAAGARVLVMDDGFQHRRLDRDVDLVLVPAESWTDRPRLLPRGRWREAPVALRRAHAVAVTAKTAAEPRLAAVLGDVARHAPTAIRFALRLQPAGWSLVRGTSPPVSRAGADARPTGPALAVAAVAEPAQFVENARAAGGDVADRLFFPDHHEYTAADLERIRVGAARRPILTTAKDAVKLSRLPDPPELWVLEQRVEPGAGGAAFWAAIEAVLA